jgi:acetylornithine deacetylase/succinyl-diaminopimelate desuccinylase-like protein
MDHSKTLEYVDKEFDAHVIPTLIEYIKIDNLSINYDPEWATNGKDMKAAQLLLDWALAQNVKGCTGRIMKLEGLSPLIHLEIESNGGEGNTFMYGHFDKQPHMEGWMDGIGPCTPKIIDDKLYGRGGADDGYAIMTSLMTIQIIQNNGLKHGKVNIIIEGSEESGSVHLFQYIDVLKEKIGKPDLMVCMDSGCKDYERLWITTSLRGVVVKDITVRCLKEACHSGVGSGTGPDSFTVLRTLLDRVEDSNTGTVIGDFQVKIPDSKLEEARQVGNILGKGCSLVKLHEGVEHTRQNVQDLYLMNTWKATLTVVGQTGLPLHSTSGNVLRHETSLRLSMRLPPTKNPDEASKRLEEILTMNPPFKSEVKVTSQGSGSGFSAEEFPEKLTKSLNNSSQKLWGKDSQTFGEGGSIPFINALGQKFPGTPFLVLGLLGPGSNAHAANEFMHIPYSKKLTAALTHAVYDFYN